MRAASNLLDARNRLAWRDLATASRLKVASSLLLALEENSFLFAEVTNKPEILMESSYNICEYHRFQVVTFQHKYFLFKLEIFLHRFKIFFIFSDGDFGAEREGH